MARLGPTASAQANATVIEHGLGGARGSGSEQDEAHGVALPARGVRMGAVEWLLLVALSALWGGSFFFSKVALQELPPFTVVFGRVGLASLVLVAAVYAGGQRLPRDPRLWGAFFAMGLLNNLIPFSLIFWGQTQIASGLASILNATTPLFTVVLAHFLTRDERLNRAKLGGVVFGLCGVAVLVGFGIPEGLEMQFAAQSACLGAAPSYGFAGIFGRRFKGLPPLVTATGQVSATTVLMVPLVLLADRPWSLPVPGIPTVAALAGLALFSTALAYTIYFRILAVAGATNLMLVTLLIPVSALLLGTSFLSERLEARHLVGTLLIGAGLLTIDGRLPAYLGARLRFSLRRVTRSAGHH